MKKIYLAFIFGIFLLGVVSALSITVEEPYETPILNAVTNSSGGSFEAGNYNFRIYTEDARRSTPNSRRSISSNTINLDLNAGDKVTLNYSIPNETDFPSRVFVIYQKDGEEWKYANDVYNDILLSSYPNQFILTSAYESSTNRFTVLENYEYYNTSMWGLNTSRGVARIRITGSSGSLSSSDIVSALESSSLVEGEDYILGGKYSIYSTASLWFDTTGGTVEIGGSKFDFFGGIYSPNANTLITATPSNYGVLTTLSSPQKGGYISGVTISNIDATGLILSDSFKDTNQLSGYHQSEANGNLKSSVIGTRYSTVSSDLKAGSIYYSVSSARLWDIRGYRDITIISPDAYLRADRGNIYDSDIYTKGYYQIFWLPNDEEGVNLYDVNFYNGDTYEKYSYDELIYRDWNYYNTNSSIKFYNSLNIKVQNIIGEIISNASIIVKDKEDNIILNTTTDENGSISEYIQTYQHNNINEEGPITEGGYNTNLNPFTIEISKEGYETYEGKMNITNPQDWTISLDEEKQSITPAALILDKIASVESLNSSSITYNITNKIINRGGSSAENLVLFDEDSPMGNYSLGNLSRGNFTLFSYLKNYERNSTNYETFLSKSKVVANDSYLENEIEDNSNQISLVIPNSETNSSLTLIKNAYYNSETSKIVNYTVSLEIVNSGGEDLENITILDSDLDYSGNIDLKRSEKYTYSENILLNKSASNTNKLFSKANGVVNSEVYQSNQLNIQIPGYGGPADAIVNAPTSVKKSESFDTEIKVLNMNEDIGQDFTINYWITNNEETKNYSSGEQTIYVGALNESKAIATLAAPSESGEYRFKTIVSWIGGIATSYDTFIVEDSSNKISGSLILKTEENLTEEKNETQKNNTEKKKEEITKKPEEENKKIIREKIKNYQEMLQKLENVLFEKKYFKTMMAIIVLFCFTLYGIYLKRKPSFEIDRLKNMKNLQVYGEDGTKIGKIKEIYLEKNKSKIYGWLVKLDKTVHKKIRNKNVLIKQKHVKSIKHIMIIEEKVSQHLEKLKSK